MTKNKSKFLAKYGDADHLHKVIDSDDDFYNAHKLTTENPLFDHTHISKLIDSEHMGVRKLAAMHPKITDSHVAKIMSNNEYGSDAIKTAVMINDNITSHAIKKAFDTGDQATKKLIGRHSFLPRDLYKHVHDNAPDDDVRERMKTRMNHEKDMDDMMDEILKHQMFQTKDQK